MRVRRILRVCDLLNTQRRVTVFFEGCAHVRSITDMEIRAWPTNMIARLVPGGELECPYCADPPPEIVRVEKSPQRLWKEAGEP